VPDPSYNTPHAPFGAFSSFTCGYGAAWEDSPAPNTGGFSASTRHPAQQSIFLGWRSGSAAWNLFPFLKRRTDRAADFTGPETDSDGKRPASQPYRVIGKAEVTRNLGLASDRWAAGPVEVTLYSPFEQVREWTALDAGRRKLLCAPVICMSCSVDNRAGTTDLEFLFGFADDEGSLRYLPDTDGNLEGFASGLAYGFAARPRDGLRARSGMDLFSSRREDERGLHLLGSEGALILRVPAGEARSLPVVLGFFQQGRVTTGLEATYYYAGFFKDLDEVLAFGLDHFDEYEAMAAARDGEHAASGLTETRKWLLAHSVHSYLASTELLWRGGRPLWIVNEGEYRMLNTFDLAVDHLFFELHWWPWAVRDTLDLYRARYSYTDSIHSTDGRHARGGIAFTHDMGVDNQFSPKGRSSYELPNLSDCFSHMSSEQLVNWVCCAVTYAEKTGDREWLSRQAATLRRCAESLRRRDDPRASRRDGIVKWDSDRCGTTGSEITTYDSLDVSLGQARNNLYLGVKTVAAWMLLSRAFSSLGDEAASAAARSTAVLAAKTVVSRRDPQTGLLPAVFEGGNESRILPSVEGLVFPLFLGMRRELEQLDADTGLIAALGMHLRQVLKRGVCLDESSGGWKLSSTSLNTWLSKIFICQFVVQSLFPELLDGDAGGPADEAHVGWLLGPSVAPLAFCDQIRSTDGSVLGSRHYPRGVTAWLWMCPQTPSRAAGP
jgi:hypothetical protein